MCGKGPSVEGLEGRRIVTTWDLLPRESVTFKPVSQPRASVKMWKADRWYWFHHVVTYFTATEGPALMVGTGSEHQ